jgi:hypothetical protein
MAIRTTGSRRTQSYSAVSSNYVAYNNRDGTVTVSGSGIGNESLTKEVVTDGVTQANSTSAVTGGGGPVITSINITDASYNNLDDTSVDSNGGYIKINGTGFTSANLSVYFNNTLISNTFVSSTQIRAVTPAIAVGNYNLFVFCNTAGALYSSIPVSGFPSFTSTSYVSSTFIVSIQLLAVGDSALTYSLYSGTLPTGLTLSANGLISGTVTEASVTSDLVVLVNDAENQTTQQTISLTIASGDPYWKNTVLLLNGETANGANAFYMDETLISNLTLFGDTRPTKNTPFTSPTVVDGSTFFDGTGDYIRVPDSTSLRIGTGSFTVEGWIYATSVSGQRGIIAKGGTGQSTGWEIRIDGSSGGQLASTWDSTVVKGTTVLSANTWYHFALVRDGTTAKLYLNGISEVSSSRSEDFSQTEPLYIGNSRTVAQPFQGFISNIRLTKQALYTANFTPSNTSLTTTSQNANSANVKLLTLKTNLSSNTLTIIDSSNTAMGGITRGNNSNVMTSSFTPYGSNWSGYFDGTGDYLTVPHNAAFQFGSGDFTVECFVYAQAFASEQVIVSKFNAGGSASSNQWILSLISGVPNFSISTDGQNVANTITGPAVTAQTWTHIAAVRSANTFTVYTNGVAGTSNTNNGSLATNEIEVLGICYRRNNGSTNFPFNGYISNLRITKGQALYTSNFTPTTYVLTTSSENANSANVSLLTCNSNQFVVQGVLSSNSSVIVSRNGDSAVTKFSPFNPTEGVYSPSIYGASYGFNGLSDVIYLAANQAIAWGAGDFTFECWVYLNASSIPSNAVIWDQRGTAGATRLEPNVGVDSTNGYTFYTRQVTRFSSGTAAVKLRQWQHLAVVRSSGTTRLYMDGIQTGGTYADGDNYPGTLSRIGQSNDGVTTRYWPGYMADVRLTVGTAVYTSNTTISTTPLARLPNTKLLLNGTGCSIFDKTMLNGIFTVGSNTSVRNTVNKFGNNSLFFDGTGDFFVANSATGDAYTFDTGDFTMEGWLYSSANTSSGQGSGIRTIFSTRRSATDTTGGRFTLGVNAANLCFYSGSSNVSFANNSGVTMNTWHHFAATRSNGTVRIFLNGSQVNSAAFATSLAANSSNVTIGSNYAGTESWNGYLDELRITKGYARYVANFTVPTDAYSEK